MFDEALVDTDVLLKAISYRLAHAALTYLADRGVQPKVLGAARFMLSSHVAKARRIADASAAAAELARAEPLLVDVEPSADETRLAAEIETLAVECGLQIDSGRMLRNIDSLQGLVFAEAVTIYLAGAIGRPQAHHLMETLTRQAVAENKTLETVVSAAVQADAQLREKIDLATLHTLFDPVAATACGASLARRQLLELRAAMH